MTYQSQYEKTQKFIPSLYAVGNNRVITGLVRAFCESDEDIVMQIRETKDQLFVSFADGNYLDLLGSNYGVFRPKLFNLSDDQFREYVKLASFKPKTVRQLIYDVFDIFWGPTASHSTITSTMAEPYNFGAVPMELTIIIDNNSEQTIEFIDGDFEFNNAATADEVCTKINLVYGDYLVAQVYEDKTTGNKYVQIYTKTPGGAGSIQITGGSANIPLAFETTKVQNTDVAIYELYPKHIIIKAPSEVPTESSRRVSHYFHQDATIVDGRPTISSADPWWPGGFVFPGPGSTELYTPTSTNCDTASTIFKDVVYTKVSVDDASSFPDSIGKVVFGYGGSNPETVTYMGRPSNTLLMLDPTYTFQYTWPIGSTIKLMSTETDARDDGSDWAIYLIDTEIGRELARYLIDIIKAAGVIVEFDITETPYLYQNYFWYDATPALGSTEYWFQPPKMDDTAQAAMVATWGATDVGKIWYNTFLHQLCMWDGSSVVVLA